MSAKERIVLIIADAVGVILLVMFFFCLLIMAITDPLLILLTGCLAALGFLVMLSYKVDQEAHAEYEQRLLERKRRNAK